MKLYRLVFIPLLWLFSPVAISGEVLSPISYVDVFDSNNDSLSIKNISTKNVEIDIYGDVVMLSPASGVIFSCGAYSHLEFKFKDISHDYFEVHCQSKVVINEH